LFNKELLKYVIAISGLKIKDLAKEIQISESAFYRKMNKDGDFSRKEILTMLPMLKTEDPLKIFFG
jgi:DNA-binding NtrC family response regulator